MRMRDNDAAQIGQFLLDEADVGQHEVDAGQCQVRKSHADVDDHPFARAGRTKTVERQVHADFPDAAERHEDKLGLSGVCHPQNAPCRACTRGDSLLCFRRKAVAVAM